MEPTLACVSLSKANLRVYFHGGGGGGGELVFSGLSSTVVVLKAP